MRVVDSNFVKENTKKIDMGEKIEKPENGVLW